MSSSGSTIAMGFIFVALVAFSDSARQSVSSSYEEFRLVHRNGQNGKDTIRYADRAALFEARKAEVVSHNARKESWKKTLNRFADFTPGELNAMMGHKPARSARSSAQSSFLQTEDSEQIDTSTYAKTMDWRVKMNTSNTVHDQGACGSCWAHAAVAALEAHAELKRGTTSLLSTQQIIDCTANPLKCGGSGGCHGATAELAFDRAQHYGILNQDSYSKGCDAEPTSVSSALQINGFVRLPENKGSHLLRALATQGPVAMSIDAGNLHLYDSGVFSGCQKDTIVNHAVLGVGYGTDSKTGKDYWQIKNSWGASWGVDGYFQIERHSDDEAYCGTDVKPEDGVYCEKHPASIRVCGMCGITSDSTYPVVLPQKSNLRQLATRSKTSKVKIFSVL